MNRPILELTPGVYLIEDFISKDTCSFLIKNFNKNISPIPDKGISGSFGSTDPEYLSLIGNYNDDLEYNVAVDFFNILCISMGNIIGNAFKSQHILKQTFYSVMSTGGSNPLHTDNSYVNDSGVVEYRQDCKYDKSGILYLNDNYEGGELYFLDQEIFVKPKPGSFIFFEGDYKKPHGVKEVTSGKRSNIITFFEPS